MPRLHGVRERRHQPFWDSLIRTTGDPTPAIQQQSQLFGNANVGNLSLTNLQVAGQLASDQTYVILALRCWLYFDGTNRRANYLRTASQLYFTLVLGDKPQFQAPCWYFPAGGGIWGFDATATTGSIFNHGEPTQEAILKLARPLVIPVRQNISVAASFFTVGTTSALDLLNTGTTDDQKVIMFMIDGLQTRDAQ
jgi:hypothetical protein